MYRNEFDLNDILRPDLMPTRFIVGEESEETARNTSDKFASSPINGSIDAALSTMAFHRKMMHEYQCRNFIAEQILEELDGPKLQRRIGEPFSKKQHQQENFYQFIRSNFLKDVGSTNYQDWLNKHEGSSTYDNDTISGHDLRTKHIQSRDGYAVYDTGETTGVTEHHQTVPSVSAFDVSKYSTWRFRVLGAPPQPPLYTPPAAHLHDEHYTKYEVEPEHHGFGLSELFEIALTGIAYLSFGMFVLHILMCISMRTKINKGIRSGRTNSRISGGFNPAC
ncbi:hypothetical protein EVAR_11690_1 [Eumeta japonica]|uniref:Uncharacterized protein n=1 Tax=Eumeta variegata TaxID=151549 RepID=A0A4C1U4H2_EUMVA|nr:hypothetical protein EVAR_11690_1 [Eumeta japonica]